MHDKRPETLPVRLDALAARLAERGIVARVRGDAGAMLAGVTQDSREVAEGDLFLALPGTRVAGTEFIARALAAGAAAALCDDAGAPASIEPLLIADDVLDAAGHCAAILTGDAAANMTLVAVTGTNGKTSCTYLLDSIWRSAGVIDGVIGTVSVRWPGGERPAKMTTPALVDLHETLAELREAGCTHAVMEVSSHALAQHRVAGCRFAAGMFTNLTRDHLDYHGDEKSYFEAKSLLFDRYIADDGVCIVNADCAYGRKLIKQLEGRRVVSFSAEADGAADVRLIAEEMSLAGMRLRAQYDGGSLELHTRLVGQFNVSNIAAAVATALALGIEERVICDGIASAAQVPGRLERVGASSPAVLVDYAHTPDALERALSTVRSITPGRVIVVFGCGGDRDCGKRPMMGAIAGRFADVAVLTSDNPRSEEPAAIIAEIERGTREHVAPLANAEVSSGRGYVVEPDRAAAIALALRLARADDVVVVAGKGHEDYQEIHGRRYPFDDRAVVRRLQANA